MFNQKQKIKKFIIQLVTEFLLDKNFVGQNLVKMYKEIKINDFNLN